MNQKISTTEEFVKKRIQGYDSGHDWWHIVRVKNLAFYINEHEKTADPFTLEVAALLHDSVDSKFLKEDFELEYKIIGNFMDSTGLEDIKNQVIEVIRNVSFSNKNPSGNLSDPVLQIIQDADKLDAMGAIGIARAFNYGGFRNNPIYLPSGQPENSNKTTIGHFYDKLLRLKDMISTPTGRRLAEEKHQFLVSFLESFYNEWNFATKAIK